MGVLYRSLNAYTEWEKVEKNSGYSILKGFDLFNGENTYGNDALRQGFFNIINPSYGIYTGDTGLDARMISACNGASGDCSIRDTAKGCTYISYDCHKGDPDHRCYKRIACSEENHFYYSFMNAAEVDYSGETNNLYETSLNASLLYSVNQLSPFDLACDI
jgi:hypothetical protein